MYLNEFKPDVFSLNELKLNEQEANYMLRFSNYVTYFKCRKKGGGGVALLIREGLDARRIGDFDNFNVEIVSAVIKLDEIKVLVMSYYNPPDQSLNEGLFYEIEEKFRHYIICGDLNAKNEAIGCKSNNPNGTIMKRILLNSNAVLLNTNNNSTYFSYNGENNDILDRFVGSSSIFNKVNHYEVNINSPLLSDHLPIMIELKINNSDKINEPIATEIGKTILNYGRANRSMFSDILKGVALTDTQKENCNIFNSNLISNIRLAAIKSIPQVKKSKKKTLPEYLLILIKSRRKLNHVANRIKQSNRLSFYLTEIKAKINVLTNLINSEIKIYNQQCWSSFLNKIDNKPVSSKIFWAKINKMRSKPNSTVIPTLIVDGVEYSSDVEKAELFGTRLAETFSENLKFEF
jgi:exonuclease III